LLRGEGGEPGLRLRAHPPLANPDSRIHQVVRTKEAREEVRSWVRDGSALTGDREAGGRREERGWAPISSSDGGGREGGKLSTPSGVLASVVTWSVGSRACFRRRR